MYRYRHYKVPGTIRIKCNVTCKLVPRKSNENLHKDITYMKNNRSAYNKKIQ